MLTTDHNGLCICATCVSPAAAVAADLASRGESITVAPGEDEWRECCGSFDCPGGADCQCRITEDPESGETGCWPHRARV